MMLLPQGGSRKFGVDPSTVRVRPATAALSADLADSLGTECSRCG